LAFRVSRFRFWLYLGGTYMTGYIIGATNLNQFIQIPFLLQLLYFIIPANVFLYGINDLADQDTDQFNVKKEEKEGRIDNVEEERDLKIILLTVTLLSLGVLLIQPDLISALLFALFYGLSFGYSYPPIRFKARPIFDFSSNILYALPGILGYYQVSGTLPPIGIWIALFLWTGAMHLFSAVPDIEADEKAGVITTAVKFGARTSLWICTVFWFVFIFITVVIFQAYTPISYIAFLYPLIPLSILFRPDLNIDRIYWFYPYINGMLGFSLSILAGWPLLTQLFS
jgi:4-hydroxybenzoate polyprenyltransferase